MQKKVNQMELYFSYLYFFFFYRNPTPDDSVDGVGWQPFSNKEDNYLSIDMPKVHMMNKFYENDIRFYTKVLPSLEESVKCG